MSKKPSCHGLLNAIAYGEGEAGEYLAAWAGVTSSPGRYIAEDRDTLRLLHGLCHKLQRHAASATAA